MNHLISGDTASLRAALLSRSLGNRIYLVIEDDIPQTPSVDDIMKNISFKKTSTYQSRHSNQPFYRSLKKYAKP